MSRVKPPGTAEQVVLLSLEATGGVWTTNDRPLYENRYWTLRLLAALTKSGYVRETIPDKKYELTTEGHQVVTRY
jgi:hypothetical protein